MQQTLEFWPGFCQSARGPTCAMRRYKGFGSFHGENVEELVRRACRADWRAPTPPELVQLSRAPIAAPVAFGRALRALSLIHI